MTQVLFRSVSLVAVLVVVGAAGSVAAQPVPAECATTVDDLGALVADLDSVLGTSGRGAVSDYGALSGRLDRDDVAARVAALSAADRRALAGKLLAIAQDRSLTGECAKDQVRYNAAMVLEAIARASLSDGSSAEDRAYFLDCLIQAAEQEQDPAAKRQMALNLDRLREEMNENQGARANALVEEYLPSSPHYPTLFGENGEKDVVDVVVHTADAEGRFGYYERAFGRSKKFERTADGSLYIEHVAEPDDPTGRYRPVTWRIRVVNEHRGSMSNFDIFKDMDEDSPAVEVYNYHSQYGSSLSRSIRNGAIDPESKKLYFLGNCKSHVNASRITAKYPKLGAMYTLDNQYMVDTPPTLKKMLSELVNRPTWSQINQSMKYANLLRSDHYLMPDDRRRLAYMDTDFDGIPDAYDTGANCGLSDPEQSHDYAARRPSADVSELSGEKIVYATHAANGILSASDISTSISDRYVADGWAPADPEGPRFVFTPDTLDGKEIVRVKVNAAYSHMSDTALTGAMLREFVLHDKSQGGRTPTRDDEVLAYAFGVKVFDAWSSTQDGAQAYRGFQEAFHLGRDISLHDAASKIDRHRGVTRGTVAHIRGRVDGGG